VGPERATALEWYTRSYCGAGDVPLGRYAEFTQTGLPYLNVVPLSAWTSNVNNAWLQGNIDSGGSFLIATDPRYVVQSSTGYVVGPPGRPAPSDSPKNVTTIDNSRALWADLGQKVDGVFVTDTPLHGRAHRYVQFRSTGGPSDGHRAGQRPVVAAPARHCEHYVHELYVAHVFHVGHARGQLRRRWDGRRK